MHLPVRQNATVHQLGEFDVRATDTLLRILDLPQRVAGQSILLEDLVRRETGSAAIVLGD